jgi:hypothetical protein
MSPSASATPTDSTWKTAGVVLFCVAAFLLISMGGAIIAAPLTVPLMFLATRRHPTAAFRSIGAVLIGATVAEAAWAVTYVVVSEAKPWIWVVPLVAALASMWTVLATSDTSQRSPVQI